MKMNALLLLALLGTVSCVVPANAQNSSHKTSSKMSSKSHSKKKAMPKHPKNEITKLEKDRKTNPTVKQITPDPKKSPGKHADNLSKNVNHELNRESKDINHVLSGKKK
ncbi:MAG: hypothetical protein JWL77_1202 [Chthonomonadaceae bacterium]|nr:hypothetical protein [Chthonomonadaceae bacterium]